MKRDMDMRPNKTFNNYNIYYCSKTSWLKYNNGPLEYKLKKSSWNKMF